MLIDFPFVLDPTLRKNVTPGSTVHIDISKDPEKANIIIGVVKKVLTNEAYCKDGILVLLENGKKGNVEAILVFEPSSKDPDKEIIKSGENESVEFKASFTFDYKRYKSTGEKTCSEKLEFYIPKSIAGFANRFGGTLYIGVDNNWNILGLKNDYEVMMVDSDKYEQKLRDKINVYFDHDESIYNNIEMHMLHYEEGDVFKINVTPSKTPFIFYNKLIGSDEKGKKEIITHPYFYVRRGNITKDYTAQEFVKYWMDHLKKL